MRIPAAVFFGINVSLLIGVILLPVWTSVLMQSVSVGICFLMVAIAPAAALLREEWRLFIQRDSTHEELLGCFAMVIGIVAVSLSVMWGIIIFSIGLMSGGLAICLCVCIAFGSYCMFCGWHRVHERTWPTRRMTARGFAVEPVPREDA